MAEETPPGSEAALADESDVATERGSAIGTSTEATTVVGTVAAALGTAGEVGPTGVVLLALALLSGLVVARRD